MGYIGGSVFYVKGNNVVKVCLLGGFDSVDNVFCWVRKNVILFLEMIIIY